MARNTSAVRPLISTRSRKSRNNSVRIVRSSVGGFTSPIIFDTFTDINGTAIDTHIPDIEYSTGWAQTASNSFYIQNNTLQPNRKIDLDNAVIDIGTTDYTLIATLVPYNVSGNRASPGVVFRYVDSSNYWYIYIESVSGNIIAVQVRAGTSIQQFNMSQGTVISGTPHTIRIDCIKGNMVFTFDGTEVVTLTDIYNSQATKVGIIVHIVGTPLGVCSWDSFQVTPFSGSYINWPIWTRPGTDTPLIALGAGGSWEDDDINDPSVQWDAVNSRWVMAYTGNSVAGNSVQQLGMAYATSLYGPWTKDIANPVFSSAAGDIDGMNGGLIKKGNTWYYYYGSQTATKISLATSSDLINWTNQGIVLQGGFEGGVTTSASLQDVFARLREDGKTIELWYRAIGSGVSLCMSYSTDGVTFRRSANNPYFSSPAFASGSGLGEPVVYLPSGYNERVIYAVFHGTDKNSTTKRFIVDALSFNAGKTWKFRMNGLRGNTGSTWEALQVFDPNAILGTDGRLYLFYGACNVLGTVLGIGIQLGAVRTEYPFTTFSR